MTQFAISLGVFRINRSCKPANHAFTMSEILRRARPRKVTREVCIEAVVSPFSDVAGIWWSRSGSNRRPEACKATALPTELRPLIHEGWWARVDSNYRPYAYQAYALTT